MGLSPSLLWPSPHIPSNSRPIPFENLTGLCWWSFLPFVAPFLTLTHTKYPYCDKIKENPKGGACMKHWRDSECLRDCMKAWTGPERLRGRYCVFVEEWNYVIEGTGWEVWTRCTWRASGGRLGTYELRPQGLCFVCVTHRYVPDLPNRPRSELAAQRGRPLHRHATQLHISFQCFRRPRIPDMFGILECFICSGGSFIM